MNETSAIGGKTNRNTVPATECGTEVVVVSMWGGNGRLVVFDPSVQPADPRFVFLYFVEGHQLCVRPGAEQRDLIAVANQHDRVDAASQYRKWQSCNAASIASKLSQPQFELEDPPARRKKCPQCEGHGTWTDQVNRVSYGVFSEGPNIVERCPTCHGAEWVKDLL